jgi:hypothetical protein
VLLCVDPVPVFEHWIAECTGKGRYHSVFVSALVDHPKGCFLPQFYGVSLSDNRSPATVAADISQCFPLSTAFQTLKHIDTVQARTLSRLLLNRSSLLAVRHARDKPPRPPSDLHCRFCSLKEPETVQHTLVRCPAHRKKREDLLAKLHCLQLRVDLVRSACDSVYSSAALFSDEAVQMHIMLCAPHVYRSLSKSQLSLYFEHISDLLGYLQVVREP